MDEELVLHGIYRHYKNPKHLYRVLGTDLDSETFEIRVRYRQIYDANGFSGGTTWTMPKKMFLENVAIDGIEIPRYKFIGTKMPDVGEETRERRKRNNKRKKQKFKGKFISSNQGIRC